MAEKLIIEITQTAKNPHIGSDGEDMAALLRVIADKVEQGIVAENNIIHPCHTGEFWTEH